MAVWLRDHGWLKMFQDQMRGLLRIIFVDAWSLSELINPLRLHSQPYGCFSQFSRLKVPHLKPCCSEMFSQPVMKLNALHKKGSSAALTPEVY